LESTALFSCVESAQRGGVVSWKVCAECCFDANSGKMAPLTDSEILNLWQDKNFLGSFSGPANLRKFLFTDYGEHVPLKRLYKILKQSPDYLMNVRQVRRFPRRHYQIYSFGQLLECDLGFMKKYKKFNYFLLVIDAFSWKIWAVPVVSKSAIVIRRSLLSVLDSIDTPVTEISSDFGGEFIANKNFFKEKKILFRPKYHQRHKAALVRTILS